MGEGWDAGLNQEKEMIMLSGYKTYVTAGVAVITAVAAYLTQDASAFQATQMVFTALMAAFMRRGIAKIG